ncbi:hypothetical protein [Pseudonocardia asaccharolytica]|uniref:Xylan 1,4-beta-xylosidase n=1 Tax=Pseudonocardia asaccharolytica DSM 44247 = NBRC 16224 TaxID=1123024 RepID=A0A511D5E9_9PSEU|nr:hypothetical protein [Pseudonocardia asaccharolytica]GEL20022.1 hypothetical protein PA7_38590 [Pseudonocardia asaccharolytica DSM 44247 = NBRC 16224]
MGALLLALTLAVVAGCSGPAADTETPTVADAIASAIDLDTGWEWQPQGNRLELGVTHTKDSLDSSEPAEARSRGQKVLSDDSGIWQNQHLMGFGTLNPEPSPGDFNWDSLDKRMQLIEDTQGRTVLTLCCAPDWMKGGEAGETDWSKLEKAPDPEHFDDFARLSAAAVERYPQIERVLVWNELKGFYHSDENRWDYEGYTELYNKVYTAVKAVRPDVQVGGPYAVMTSLKPGSENASDLAGPWGAADKRALDIIDYWLEHNVGADFIAVDGSTATRNGGDPDQVDAGAQKFADVTRWIQQRTPLAVWWAEFYADTAQGAEGGAASPASAVATLATVAAFARSGVSVALLWGPQGSSLKYSALWTDSTESDGGKPTPLTRAWQWLVPRLAKGGIEIGRSATQPLLAFRADDGAVIVNLTGTDVPVPGHDPLPAWGVAVRTM